MLEQVALAADSLAAYIKGGGTNTTILRAQMRLLTLRWDLAYEDLSGPIEKWEESVMAAWGSHE
jgi:hypothetical protein